jgi:hypothetical protein
VALRVAALVLVAALSVGTASAGQLTLSSEIQASFYPRDPIGRDALDSGIRGWVSLEFERALGKSLDFDGDVVVYESKGRRAVVDGEAKLVWRGANAELAGGLLRERWGRFVDSALDPLGAANTPFSLVGPEQRLGQPAVRATAFLDHISLDVYALVGHRPQPLPGSEGRFGFGVPTTDVVRRGHLAEQALAVRISSTQPELDWSAHIYGGLNRRPTFLPRFTADAQLSSVDAVYTEILQFGGELETTRADWRFLAEGFGRTAALDVTGRKRTYASIAAAAEYQRLGAFDGAYNVIPRFEFMADTRGDRADVPFASALRAGLRVASTRLRPVQFDMAYSFDWAFRGHGVLGSIEKTLAESPAVKVGFQTTAFFAGSTRSVLDIWEDDLELFGSVRVELSW